LRISEDLIFVVLMVRRYPGDEIALGTDGVYLMGRKMSGYQQIGGTEDTCDAIVSDVTARGVESELEMIADPANSIEGRCVTC
jgi:sulfur transfer complex TusBCD TusB component (DsrH family)